MGPGRALWRMAQYGYVASSSGNSVIWSHNQEKAKVPPTVPFIGRIPAR